MRLQPGYAETTERDVGLGYGGTTPLRLAYATVTLRNTRRVSAPPPPPAIPLALGTVNPEPIRFTLAAEELSDLAGDDVPALLDVVFERESHQRDDDRHADDVRDLPKRGAEAAGAARLRAP